MSVRADVSQWELDAIGTRWQVQTFDVLSDTARDAVRGLIDAFDRDWSRFRDDSLVSALARGAGVVAAPPDTRALLDTYAALAEATAGAVNPLVGDALARRGYDAAYRFVDQGAEAAPSDWRTRLAWTDDSLLLTEPATLDVGAIGKGRLVDHVASLVAQWAEGPVVVDAGGDIVVRDGHERIALEHPYDTSRAIGVWEVTDAALCASATNRRAWGDGLHHVLDARTGEPVRRIAATWAVAHDAMTADAVATALFFDGGPEIAAEWDASWVRMTTDGRVDWSPRCDAELFLSR
ncbi:FAD:protein FMN transferase [Microbacterium sp. No. 7]|uniref:FAD:protein FMN transferase n=1 Tax=Microbacterium sp. No. 7 TaxID=1714373 RepID=UPI0006D24A2F|nr:FAD:protein FMN transferase [Microbacterium sp. No. 7]ALJ19815.1 hypothetical protein AOA12_07810 [Microbacterium sp. No. 7]